MTVDELINCVGMEYRQLDEKGKALGCLLPFYLLHPEAPRFDWPDERIFAQTVLDGLKKYSQQVNPKDVIPGDLLAFRMPLNFLHIGIYLGNDQVIHCMTNQTMETMRLWNRRIEGVYRYGSACGI